MSNEKQQNACEEAEREEIQIRDHIHDQILGISDQRRSKEIWLRILSLASQKCIANALSEQLTHFNYQEVPANRRPGNCS